MMPCPLAHPLDERAQAAACRQATLIDPRHAFSLVIFQRIAYAAAIRLC